MLNRIIPDRFIAANILPPHPSMKDPLPIMKEQIDTAIHLGFNFAWFNPISKIVQSNCHRRCNDTGVMTDFQYCLYAPNDLVVIQDNLPVRELKKLNEYANTKNFSILIDFVWKHLSVNSSKFSMNKKWKGKTVNDVIEYAFYHKNNEPNHDVMQEVLYYLKHAIDLYLNGCGFSGLRIDAASHLPAKIREALILYIRDQHPHAIIMEEVLFDGAQEKRIEELVHGAKEKNIYSHFVTSNLFYKMEDSFGQLPLPNQMGDFLKIQLANDNGISFTGNHDHYSAGWSIILSMAAKRFMKDIENDKDKTRINFLEKIIISPSNGDMPHFDTIRKTIKTLTCEGPVPESDWKTIENVDNNQLDCIRYLLPLANEIARELLDKDHINHEEILNQFKVKLLKTMANRTMASMSGYFVLFSELTLPFETQRIFSNDKNQPLPFLLLTIDDLKNQSLLTIDIINQMIKNKNHLNKYNNIANFIKSVPKPNFNNNKTIDIILFAWLPFIIEYLRNNPEENKYDYYQTENISGKTTYLEEATYLSNRLQLKSFIQQINSIYAKLETLTCHDYQAFTFATQDDFKIFVRCKDTVTDIIILNLSDNPLTINDLDIQKIALWYQSRKFPPKIPQKEKLATPFTNEEIVYFSAEYSCHYRNHSSDTRESFDDAYNRIVNAKKDHQTNLYLGYEIKDELDQFKSLIKVVSIKTEHREISQLLEKAQNNPITNKRKNTKPLYGEIIEQPLIIQKISSPRPTQKITTSKIEVKIDQPLPVIPDNWDDSDDEIPEKTLNTASNIQRNSLFSATANLSTTPDIEAKKDTNNTVCKEYKNEISTFQS